MIVVPATEVLYRPMPTFSFYFFAPIFLFGLLGMRWSHTVYEYVWAWTLTPAAMT